MRSDAMLGTRHIQAGLALRFLLIAIFVMSPFTAGSASPDRAIVWPTLATFDAARWLGLWIAGPSGARLATAVAIMALDFVCLRVLSRTAAAEHRKAVELAWWFCPATLYLFYGQERWDVLPAALLLTALSLIGTRKFNQAACVYAFAIPCSLGVVVTAPFFGLYLLGRARLRRVGLRAIILASALTLLLAAPTLIVPTYPPAAAVGASFRDVAGLSIPLQAGARVAWFPVLYAGALLWVWRVRSLDIHLLWGIVGMSLVAMLLPAPGSASWALLAMPFLALHAGRAGRTGLALFALLAASIAGLHWTDGASGLMPRAVPGLAATALTTIIFALTAAMLIQMFRRSVVRSSFFQATRRPVLIGVGGDSGSGKDALVDSFAAVVGARALAHVSGDDYHVWDRGKPMWRALTHLNPKANDLEAFERNVGKLSDRRWIEAPHYDHKTGRMSKPVRTQAAEFVVASGLHALWSPALNDLYDIKVFLSMEPELRRFLKVRRDVHERGHPVQRVLDTLERRREDSERFIEPQADSADLILKLQPRHPSAVADFSRREAVPLRLSVSARPGLQFDHLARLLTSLCGMQVIETHDRQGRSEVLIEGEPTAQDIAAAARRLTPELLEFIDLEPRWEPGLSGVMQLILIDQVDRVRLRRGVKA